MNILYKRKKIDESDDIDKVGGRIMLTLSGKIVVNVEASYIETYLRKKRICKNRGREGKES